jgi:hypothetical protein
MNRTFILLDSSSKGASLKASWYIGASSAGKPEAACPEEAVGKDDVNLVTATHEPCSPSLRVYRARAGNEANPHDVSNGPSCGGSADGLLVLSTALYGLIQSATVEPTVRHYTVPFVRLTPLGAGLRFEPATHCPVLV